MYIVVLLYKDSNENEFAMKGWIMLTILYVIFWLWLIFGSFSAKVKGILWLTIYIVVGAAMSWLRPLMTSVIASIVDTVLFLLLLLWIVVINKHSSKRRKEQ